MGFSANSSTSYLSGLSVSNRIFNDFRFKLIKMIQNKTSKWQRFLFNKLVKERKSPCFEVQSSQIKIINDPQEYYLALHKLAADAEQRISMSALYLGTGKLEKYLVEKLNQKVKNNADLRLTVLLDYMRGTRINRQNESS